MEIRAIGRETREVPPSANKTRKAAASAEAKAAMRADSLRNLLRERSLLSREGVLYQTLRWGYQPLKQTLSTVRELQAWRHRRKVLSQRLQGDGFKGLLIGCGPARLPDWMCTDQAGTPNIDFAVDIERPLPFEDGVLDAVYGSEVIEHIPRKSVAVFLQEAHRALRPGGVLRLTTPDLKALCEIYLGIHPTTSLADLEATWIEPEFSGSVWINSFFRSWGHQWLWDFESLSELMRATGFEQIERAEPQVTHSGLPQLQNVETRYGMPAPPHAWTPSMIVEAVRPSAKPRDQPS